MLDRMLEVQAGRLAELAARAAERAAEVSRALEDLLAAVEEVRLALAEARTPDSSQPPSAELPAPPVSLDAARLVALEMAVGGRRRAEVERHLSAVYRGPDTEALLDDVFGTAEERRRASPL
jgi:hypothetical protein